ncbi:MAG: D-ala-D-ala transporter subunit [Hyphomicrobiales bacterium]|nr:MAG: D-ala-D-ala transporter subunit [Hyphomicrobiales bacterium]
MSSSNNVADVSSDESWREWLTSGAPQSRGQARCVQAYLGWLTFRSNTLAMIGLGILVTLILVAFMAPLLATYDPNAQELYDRLMPLWSEGHFLGTDHLGRDIYSRLIYGAGITLYIVALVAAVAPIVGLLVGTASGYFGGWIDIVLMRFTDIFLAFPRLVLALAFVAVLGAGIENAVLAITLTAWPPYARIARAETITIREADFIAVVKLQGLSPFRIILGHIWPLCISSLIVRVTLDMAGIILTAAGLGFLGLGAQPPLPEWGAMISEGRRFILDQWWVATMPGLAIFIVSLGFNLLGDGLRDVLDPKQAES